MAEYIEREAAVHLLMNRGRYLTKDLVMDAAYEVSKISAADVAPVVHGRWIYDHWCEFKCSVCGTFSDSKPYKGRENYCPNCGADMRGE